MPFVASHKGVYRDLWESLVRSARHSGPNNQIEEVPDVVVFLAPEWEALQMARDCEARCTA